MLKSSDSQLFALQRIGKLTITGTYKNLWQIKPISKILRMIISARRGIDE
jgi:hypothetical protein